jgi:hypothetical protein
VSIARRRSLTVVGLVVAVAVVAFLVARLQAQSCGWGANCLESPPDSCRGLHVNRQTTCAMYSYWDPTCGGGYCCQGVVYCCYETTGDCGNSDWAYCTGDPDCGGAHDPCPCFIIT